MRYFADSLQDEIVGALSASQIEPVSRSMSSALRGPDAAKAIERLRVEAARALLDSQPLRVEDVAIEAGFGDPERMRRAFMRAFGQPPQALRRAART